MYPLGLALLLGGCMASVAGGPETSEPAAMDQRAPAGDARADDLRKPSDLQGTDLRPLPPDFAGLDLGGRYAYPRVNEVVPAAGGMNGEEFIELAGGATDVPLAGYTLRYQAAGGGDAILLTFGDVVLVRGSYLLVAAAASRFGSAADVVFSGGASGRLAKTGGAVALFDGTGTRIDSLAWGSAVGSFVEGRAAPAPGDQSCSRWPDGIDTDRNEIDARTAEPTPRAPNL